MKNEYKKYNLKLLKVFFILLIFIGLLNYIINPYNIFTQHFCKRTLLKPEAKVQERLTKILSLKFNKSKLDTVFIGSSRTDLGIAKGYYTKLTLKNAENLAMGDITPQEIIDTLDIALKIHPEIQNIFIGLDYQYFLQKGSKHDNRAEITNNPNLTPNDIGIALFSYKSTGNAIWSIIKTLSGNRKRVFYSSGEKYIFKNPNIKNEFMDTWRGFGLSYQTIPYSAKSTNNLLQYIKILQNFNKNVVVFVYPSHISELYLIYLADKWQEYESWKTTIAEITPIYDFQNPNEFTTDKIVPEMNTYFDASHGTYIVGNKMIDDLINCPQKACKYARYITKENVKEINSKNLKDIENWIQENPQLVKEIKEVVGRK